MTSQIVQPNSLLRSPLSASYSSRFVSSSVGSMVSIGHPQVRKPGDKASIFSQTIEEPIFEGVSSVWDQLGEGLKKYHDLGKENEEDKVGEEEGGGTGWKVKRFETTVRAVLRIERFNPGFIGKRYYTELFHDRINIVNYSKTAGSCLLGEEIHKYIHLSGDKYELASVFLPVGTIGMVVGEIEIFNGSPPISYKILSPTSDPFPLPVSGKYYIVLGSIPFNYRGSKYFLFHQNEINRLDHSIWSGGGDERIKLYNVNVLPKE